MSLQFGSESYLYVQTKSLQLLGIEFPGNAFPSLRLSFIFWILCAGDIFEMVCMGIGGVKNVTDLEIIVETMIPLVQVALGIWKIFIFLNTKKAIIGLMQEIRKKSLEANEEEIEIILRENAKDRLLNRIYFMSCISCGSLCYLLPLVISIFLTRSRQTLTLIMPVQGSWPLDVTILRYYMMIFVNTMISVHFSVFTTVSVDGIFSWIVHNISAQFQRLELKLKNLADKNMELESLIDCVRFHQWIINTIDTFGTLFRPIIFVEIFFSCMQLCFVVFRMVHGLSLQSTPFVFAFLIVVFIQLYIYCYQGQRIQNESEHIASVIYECFHWNDITDQEQQKKQRKILLISMMRAQHCCKLDGIFFTVNLELFLWIVRTASSYVTVLKSMGVE